jgi:hypothetical protein
MFEIPSVFKSESISSYKSPLVELEFLLRGFEDYSEPEFLGPVVSVVPVILLTLNKLTSSGISVRPPILETTSLMLLARSVRVPSIPQLSGSFLVKNLISFSIDLLN